MENANGPNLLRRFAEVSTPRLRFGIYVVATVFFCFVPFGSRPAEAQSYLGAGGTPTFAAPEPVEMGFTDTSNGNLHLEVPFASFRERASQQPLTVGDVYDSNIVWTIFCGGSGCSWEPVGAQTTSSGWRVVDSGSDSVLSTFYCGANLCGYILTDPIGATRSFFFTDSTCPVPNAYASDSSGFMIIPCSEQVYAPDGTLVYGGGTIDSEDSNGNYISGGGLAGVQDTLGRYIYTVPGSCDGVNGEPTCYNIPNSQGGTSTSTYTVTTATISVKTNFGQSGVSEYSGTMTVVQSIELPDGTSYTFKYDCDSTTSSTCGSPTGQSAYYGLLTSMTLPTGGTITYAYTTFSDSYSNKAEWLSSRTSASGTWTYSPQVISTCSSTQVGCQQKVTVTKPSSDSTIYTFTLNNGAWPVQVQSYGAGNILLSTVTNTYDFSNACLYSGCYGAAYIRLLNTQTTLTVPGGSITKQTVYGYDSPQKGNITTVSEWGYYPGTSPSFPSTPNRETKTAFLSTGTNDIDRPQTVTVFNNSGVDIASSTYTYDVYEGICPGGGLESITGMSNHDDTNFGSSYTERGNLTHVAQYVSGSTYLTTSYCYDTTGQVTEKLDAAANVTGYSYADNFYNDPGSGPPTSYKPSQPTNAYVTSITLPIIGTESLGYYYGSGNQALLTDQNNATTYYHSADPFSRPTQTVFPIGWNLETYPSATESDTYTAVGDISPSVGCSSCRHDQTFLDSWGRQTEETLANNPIGAVNVSYTYDSDARLASESHAYTSTSDPNYVFENYTYDGLDRSMYTTHPDGEYSSIFYGASVALNGGLSSQQGSTSTYGVGYPELMVDENGKQKQEWIDGFGRVIEVDEPSGTSWANPVVSLYLYDALGDLTSVVQGTQTRTFTYDELGRKTSETTPESGTVSYSYTGCSKGNLCSITDARGITKTYAYDGLNRMTSKTYSNGEGSVTFSYDQGGASAFALGRLTQMADPSGSETYTYDADGDVLQMQKVIGTTTYTLGYQYNAGGELTQVTYPSGRVVGYSYNPIGQLCEVAPSLSTSCAAGNPYASGYSYDPSEDVTGFTYGNGLFASYNFAPKTEQLSCLDYSTTNRSGTCTHDSTTMFGLSYYYQVDPTNCPNGTADDDGPINCITDSVYSGRTVNYTYDGRYRLNSAVTNGQTGYPQWGLAWTYDQWGNRLTQSVTAGSGPSSSLSFNGDNQPTGSGYVYDASGDMTYDPGTLDTYGYDGDSRLVSVSGGATASYTYDGNGMRVEKSANGTTTVFIYSGSKDIAEYANGAAPSSPSQEFIYGNGQLLAQMSGGGGPTTYYQWDHLSVRMTTNSNGSVVGQQGHFPFGESWYSSNGSTEWTFSTYQNNTETGLDYALARYYDTRTGGFCSADPVEGDPEDPESWNRYVYVRDNPINLTDPSGQFWGWFAQIFENIGEAIGGFLDSLFAGHNSSAGTAADVAASNGYYLPAAPVFDTLNGVYTMQLTDAFVITPAAVADDGFNVSSVPSFLTSALRGLEKQKLNKKNCAQDLKALGTDANAVRQGAANANLINGTGSNVLESSLYANTPAYNAAQLPPSQGGFGTQTIGQFLAQPNNWADSQLLGHNIYVNPGRFSPGSYWFNLATMMHEVLHNITGDTDQAIQSTLGLKVDPNNTANITNKLIRDCF